MLPQPPSDLAPDPEPTDPEPISPDAPRTDPKVGPEPASLARAPRCGARTRGGATCRSPAVQGRARCRMHGGKGGGAPRGNRNAWKHGARSARIADIARILRATSPTAIRRMLLAAGSAGEAAGREKAKNERTTPCNGAGRVPRHGPPGQPGDANPPLSGAASAAPGWGFAASGRAAAGGPCTARQPAFSFDPYRNFAPPGFRDDVSCGPPAKRNLIGWA